MNSMSRKNITQPTFVPSHHVRFLHLWEESEQYFENRQLRSQSVLCEGHFLNEYLDGLSTIWLRLVPCLLAYSLAFATISSSIKKVMFTLKTLNKHVYSDYEYI